MRTAAVLILSSAVETKERWIIMRIGRLLLGAAVGAIIALMIAPKKGEELRGDIKELWEKVSEGQEEPLTALKELYDRVMPKEAKEKVKEAAKTVSPTEV